MANPSNSPLAQKIKRKQMLILGGVGLVIMLIAIVSSYFMGDKKPKVVRQTVTSTRNLIEATTDSADRERWRERSAQDIEKLRFQMQEQSKINADLMKLIEKTKEDQLKANATEKASTSAVVPPPDGVPVAGRGFLPGNPVPMAPGVNQGSALGGPGMVMPGGKTATGQPMMPESGDAISSLSFNKPEAPDSKSAPGSKGNSGGAALDAGATYIPAGSFARAVVLGGVDAPTGGQAQSNPHPVLLRILGDARLPGNARISMKDCVATADALGDLSSERVQIRLQKLSCRVGADKMVDIAVKGHLNGEDGKAGMRARLVTKTGQVLTNALLTGTLSALGTAIQATSQTTTGTALGTTVTTGNSTEDVVRYAAGGGVSQAFDRLADYYIKLADKIFPILEMDSMRIGDIVFSQGFTLETI
jgi:conjugal transfer pilus assembly protein TraB